MSFGFFLEEQIKKHPSVQPQDVVKLCYQAAYGSEHLMSDYDGARKYLEEEYSAISGSNGELYEQISDKVCRVNLSAWKAEGLPVEWLFRMFAASCVTESDAEGEFGEYLQIAEQLLRSADVGFTMQEWKNYLDEYKKNGMHSVHHSERYHNWELPSYRIADIRFCRIIPVLLRAKDYLNGDKPCVISIDGRAASGKTTLADILQIILDADIIHMDDFFVPPELRTQERFITPGENVHHERFAEEVLPFIKRGKPFDYRIFDCGIMDYNGKRSVGNRLFRIVEGSYSCHPVFGAYADITVFSDVTADEQIRRIRNRNGEAMLKMFRERWIPMEEEYFTHYAVRGNAELIFE